MWTSSPNHKHTKPLTEAFHCGYVQQVHGRCGFVGLVYGQIQVPHEIPTLVRVHLLAHHHPCCDQRLAPLQAGLQSSKMPKQEILSRRQFQADLASSLILVNTTPLKTPKRGRPSSGNGSPAPTVTSRSPLNAQKRPSSGDGSPPNGAPSKRSQPPLDVRKDLMAHFPVKTKRGRCRHCSVYTNTQCTKCDVRLCFSDDRNCFWDYHCIIIE
ncbi:hypothetical protein F7725_013344 [Dissostichus mawsoni]|uniref:Uncharacterized protein n=1 Tax=Dissostichus mawsoni TaxID=36200 RepID=A0A7J5YPT1_DISMA|nr:hypothetical protein F7725_013344 [Dissostichus mawsoni]